MSQIFLTQLEYLLRLLLAVLCGLALGFERENHLKMAGIRTHMIVALASALMMIVSKYGFSDVIAHAGFTLDPSRIAAGVVTAIGFLGAGVIFTHNMNTSGLTTSAGIWATVGIGTALGAGMYFTGIASTAIVLLIQFCVNRSKRKFRTPAVEQIILRMDVRENLKTVLETTLHAENISIISTSVIRTEDSTLEVKLYVHFPNHYNAYDLVHLLQENPHIISVSI